MYIVVFHFSSHTLSLYIPHVSSRLYLGSSSLPPLYLTLPPPLPSFPFSTLPTPSLPSLPSLPSSLPLSTISPVPPSPFSTFSPLFLSPHPPPPLSPPSLPLLIPPLPFHDQVILQAVMSLPKIYMSRNLTADQLRKQNVLSISGNPQTMLSPTISGELPCEFLSLEIMQRWILCTANCTQRMLTGSTSHWVGAG